MPVQTDGSEDYKEKYKVLKRKLKFLIYENECFQEELRKAQRALLRVRRDKSFLLDRLLQHYRGHDSSSDSEQTEESDMENEYSKADTKRRRVDASGTSSTSHTPNSKSSSSKKKKSNSNTGSNHTSSGKGSSGFKHSGKHGSAGHVIGSNKSHTGSSHKSHLKMGLHHAVSSSGGAQRTTVNALASAATDGQMSREELERHLAARQSMSDFTTTVSLTLPNQLFSDNIMDIKEEDADTSPSNLDDEVLVDSLE